MRRRRTLQVFFASLVMLLATMGARAAGAGPTIPESAAGDSTPIAHAGADQTVEGGSSVTLDGTSSWDADGDTLAFSWTQVEGPAVSVDLSDPAHPRFTAPTPGVGAVPAQNQVVVFSLTVSDGANVSAPSTVRITVLKPFDPVNDTPAIVTNTGCRDPLNTSQYLSGSFGKALQWATTHPGTRVTFRLPATDPNYNAAGGYWQWPACTLPMLQTVAAAGLNSNGTTIDGWSQRAYGAANHIFVNPDGPAIFYPQNILQVGYWTDAVAPERIVIRGLAQDMYVEKANHLVLSGNHYNMYPDGMRQARSGNAQLSLPSGVTTCVRLGVRGGSNIRIGGATVEERNLVGHGCAPLLVSPYATAIRDLRVVGNYFGLDRSGAALPLDVNVWLPVQIDGTSSTVALDLQFGGVEPGSGNVAAGFGTQTAVNITMGREGNRVVVLGNKFGTNADGTVALPNRDGLVLAIASKTGIGPEWIVGGPEPGAGNLLSGNRDVGLWIQNQGGDMGWRLRVQGNRIGTTADGQSPLPNGNGLIAWPIGYDVLIGGSGKGEGNLVSGNHGHGMSFSGYKAIGSVPKIFGNLIGVAADGTTALGNGGVGVYTNNGDYAMPVGGVAPGEGNTIAFNGGHGYSINPVCCTAGGTQRGTARGNSIHSNGGLGISLQGSKIMTPLANNAGDGVIGWMENNAGRNYPVLTSASISAAGTTIAGTLDTIAGLSVTLDFYANSAADPSGNGEGETYLGSHSFVAGSGPTAFTAVLPGVSVAVGQVISSTTTDSSGNTSEFSRTVPVVVTNSAPALAPIADRSDDEGSTVNVMAEASDPDDDTLTFSATGLPAGITIDQHTGVMSGTFGYDAAGSYTVSVTVSDGSASASDTFTWTVVDVNRAPTLAPIADRSDNEGTLVSVMATASDLDGDAITFSATGLPAGITIDQHTGVMSGTFGYDAAGSYTVSVTVSAGSASASDTFTWTVVDVNRAPTLALIADRSDDEGTTVNVTATASDPDGDAITFSATGLPPGIAIHSQSGLMSGALGYNAASSYTVSVTVSDGSASASDTFTWTVVDMNRAPTAMGDTYAALEDQMLMVASPNVLANDSDADGHALTRAVVTPPTRGTLSFDADGTLRYTPYANLHGNDSFTYRAFDGTAYSDPVTVSITVQPVNDAPTLTVPPDQKNDEGDAVSVQVQAADIDSAPLEYGAQGLPAGLSIDPATGLITGTVAPGSGGSYTVTVTVRDSHGAEAAAAFAWSVDAPAIRLNCSTAMATVQAIWPPNHHAVTVGVTGLIGTANLTIRIDRILQDEPTLTLGDGNTAIDGGGIGTPQAWVRAERSGTPAVPGNGRFYEILFTASDAGGASCSGAVFTGVPHDQKKAVVEDPVRYDSTTGARVR